MIENLNNLGIQPVMVTNRSGSNRTLSLRCNTFDFIIMAVDWEKCFMMSLHIGNDFVSISNTAWSIGYIFDLGMSFVQHVNSTCTVNSSFGFRG